MNKTFNYFICSHPLRQIYEINLFNIIVFVHYVLTMKLILIQFFILQHFTGIQIISNATWHGYKFSIYAKNCIKIHEMHFAGFFLFYTKLYVLISKMP